MGRIKIMGILNVTPDSFYDGGRHFDRDSAVERAYAMRDEGADIIDIGGESTRPGSLPVSADEEIARVCPVIRAIAGDIGIPVSIDTCKGEVAREALGAGASIVNDVTGLTNDPGIADAAAKHGASIVLMHMKGRPATMQENPVYGDLLGEICLSLADSARVAMEHGVQKERIILDPGIGFGKTLEDNYRIIKNLHRIRGMGFPVLIGLSRKSLIGRLYPGDEDRLPATIALNMISVLNGADIVRVHDVRQHRLALMSIEALEKVS